MESCPEQKYTITHCSVPCVHENSMWTKVTPFPPSFFFYRIDSYVLPADLQYFNKMTHNNIYGICDVITNRNDVIRLLITWKRLRLKTW